MQSTEEVEQALRTAHESIAQLKLFVSGQEAINKQRKKGQRRARSPGGSPRSDSSDGDQDIDGTEAAAGTDDLFDGMMQYIRSTVLTSIMGGYRSSPGRVLKPQQKSTRHKESEAAQLRALLKATVHELEVERTDKHNLMNEVRQFNSILEEFRVENNVLQIYKDRIVELQSVINGTKRPGEVSAEIGEVKQLVPVNAVPTKEQKRQEVANELARLAVQAKDKTERHKVENMKLHADKMALIGQNTILTDRVKVLEAQLSVLTASSSVALRELNKKRLQSAIAVEAPTYVQRKLAPGQVRVGGTVMEAEVAVWLKDMYQKLLQDPDATRTLMTVEDPQTPQAASLRAGGGVSQPDTMRPESAGSLAIGGGGGVGVAPARTGSATSRASSQQRTSTPASTSRQSPASVQSHQRDGKSFAEFVSDVERTAQQQAQQ